MAQRQATHYGHNQRLTPTSPRSFSDFLQRRSLPTETATAFMDDILIRRFNASTFLLEIHGRKRRPTDWTRRPIHRPMIAVYFACLVTAEFHKPLWRSFFLCHSTLCIIIMSRNFCLSFLLITFTLQLTRNSVSFICSFNF